MNLPQLVGQLGSNPFFTVAPPMILAVLYASWRQDKRIEDLRDSLNRRLDNIDRRLERIDETLHHFHERMVRVEERPWR